MSDAGRMSAEPAEWDYLADDEVDTIYVATAAFARGRSPREVADRAGAVGNHLDPPEPRLAAFLDDFTERLAGEGVVPDGDWVVLSLTATDGTLCDLTQLHFSHQPPDADRPYLVLTVHGGTDVLELSTDAATDDERDTIRRAVRAVAAGLHVVEGVLSG